MQDRVPATLTLSENMDTKDKTVPTNFVTTANSPTISMRTIKHAEGSYTVELIVSGLRNEQQAEAAMTHLQRALCGSEIASH